MNDEPTDEEDESSKSNDDADESCKIRMNLNVKENFNNKGSLCKG